MGGLSSRRAFSLPYLRCATAGLPEPIMPKRQFEALMWADACAAIERAERLRRQFFHHASPYWEAPIDVLETNEALFILIALPGVELDNITVTMSAGILVVEGERPLPRELQSARIVRMEIPHGRFERRIELPPVPFQISGRHLANGCLMLRLQKG
jgi:HSP20 family protein